MHQPLPKETVSTIKEQLNSGMTCAEVSRLHKVSYSTIYNIREGITYLDIQPVIKRGIAKSWVVHKEITNQSAPTQEVVAKIPNGWGYKKD